MNKTQKMVPLEALLAERAKRQNRSVLAQYASADVKNLITLFEQKSDLLGTLIRNRLLVNASEDWNIVEGIGHFYYTSTQIQREIGTNIVIQDLNNNFYKQAIAEFDKHSDRTIETNIETNDVLNILDELKTIYKTGRATLLCSRRTFVELNKYYPDFELLICKDIKDDEIYFISEYVGIMIPDDKTLMGFTRNTDDIVTMYFKFKLYNNIGVAKIILK